MSKVKTIKLSFETYELLKEIKIKYALRTFDNTIRVLITSYNNSKLDELFNMLFLLLKSIKTDIEESKKAIITHISEIVPKKTIYKKPEKQDFRKWQKEEIKCRFCNSFDVKVTTIFVTKDGYMLYYRYVCNACRTREKVKLPKPINLKRFYSTTLPPIESLDQYAYPPRYRKTESDFF